MTYSDSLYQSPLIDLARAGNFQAIAHWLCQSLNPYGIGVKVGKVRPGCIKVLVELPSEEQPDLPPEWQDYLVRFICHRIWQLDSALIEGVRIGATLAGESQILWERSVRVISPARQQHRQTQRLQTKINDTTRRKSQIKLMRAFLMSGTPLFAFIFGCVLGFAKAPVDQTNAVASPKNTSPEAEKRANRPNSVQTALETVPVLKHDKSTSAQDPTVTLMFSGDVTLAESFADSVGHDYDHAFAALNEYREADLAMVNLENPLTRATLALPNKQFNFKADPELVKVLEKGGVDLVTLANNHTMDYKEPGLVETMQTLDQAGILHMGAGRDEKEARRPEIIDVKGQRVAYLAYYGADFQAATDHSAGTNFADEARIAADIKSIRNQVDWVVVNFHWGEELATHPADWQIDLAHYTIDQGADVIVGHHPHVLQGAEIYKGRPIAYSMGNFIFGGNSRKDYDTALLKVALKDQQMKVEFLPIEVRDFQPKVVTGDRGSEILKQIHDLSTAFKQPMQSPAVLDARQTPSVEPTPTVSPSPQASPAQPATPARSYPFDPYAPAPPGADASPPSVLEPTTPPAPTPPATASPAPDAIAPSATPAVPSFTSPEPSIPADMLPSPTPSPTGIATPGADAPDASKSLTPETESPGAEKSLPAPTPPDTNNFYSPDVSPTPQETTPAPLPAEGLLPGDLEPNPARTPEPPTNPDETATISGSPAATRSKPESSSFIQSPHRTPLQLPNPSKSATPIKFEPSPVAPAHATSAQRSTAPQPVEQLALAQLSRSDGVPVRSPQPRASRPPIETQVPAVSLMAAFIW